MSPTTAHLEKLNAPQRRAVTYGEALPNQKGWKSGPLLIVAGAGTGKTNTLAHRVAHLVINGADPSRILLLTFTRRAAQEMTRRARDIVRTALSESVGGLGQSIAQRLSWSGTFHAIGNRLLRHYATHVGLDPHFTVLDRADSADLVDNLREELGFAKSEKRFPRKDTCLAIYSHRVNTDLPLKETLTTQFPWCVPFEEQLTKIFRGYVARKQELSLLDYDDLLLFWHTMMSDVRMAQHVGKHFDHVLVDEYQDTNRLQADILQALRPDGSGVTVVGDDAQAIYSFRAAAVDNILGFPERFKPRAETVTLAQNYRSAQPILDTANALMSDAPRQYRKHLISSRGGGPMPRVVTADDLQSQAEYVCAQVLRRREANLALKRQAVLFRTGSHSDLLEIELTKNKIPFVKYGGLKFLEAAHIKDMLAILRWIDNPRNTLAAFRALQLLPGMGPVNARKALDHFIAAGSTFNSLAEFKPPTDAKLPFKRFVDLTVVLSDPQKPWPGQVRLVREWYKPHLERLYDHVHTRVGDLDQIELLSTQYPSRDRFLTELTLDPPQASSDIAAQALLDEDYLVLSTVHSAKGMEWDAVYVMNVVEGSFPNEYAAGKEAQMEEERRLLYVAMTRAKDDLILIAPLKFAVTSAPPSSDAHVYGGKSRFMTEKVTKTLEASAFHGSHMLEAGLQKDSNTTLDVAARARQMW